jgi:propionyl-CoA synthetase
MDKLPKTRSGKILRGTIRKICNGYNLSVIPPTIDDPESISKVKAATDVWIKTLSKV